MTRPRNIPPGVRARLRLLATTDLHMHLTGHDYYADRPNPSVGLTRTASLIARARDEAARDGALTLLFDNGDMLQGTPLGDLVADRADRPHPLMRAFGHLRYDAVGLGNHDFNFGLKTLAAVLRQAPCPVLCSNMRRTGGNPPGFQPCAILDRIVRTGDGEWPVRIGVLSFLPPQTMTWDAHLLRDQVEVDDICASARRWLPDLQRAGCDLIVALAHTGLSHESARAGMENAVIPLAALGGIDAIVAGHTHLHLPGPDHAGMEHVDAGNGAVHGRPVVMPGSAGSHLGVIDLELQATPLGNWQVAGFECALRPIARRDARGRARALVPEDPGLVALLAEDHGETRALMGHPVGFSDRPMHSYFTLIGQDRALALVGAAQAAALRPLLADTDAADLPLLSAAAPGKYGGRAGPEHFTDVPAGPLSLRHVADLHVFPNELRALVVTGAQLFDWLEMSAGIFHHIAPGSSGAQLIDANMPGHDFDVLFGLTYEIDLSVPARFHANGRLRSPASRRVGHVCFDEIPVTPDQRFVVALNSHRAGGGGNVAALAQAQPVPLPPMTIRAALRKYLDPGQPVDPLALAPSPWRFAPMPGASVTALTGPGAKAHLAELSDRAITADGLDECGFLRLNVPL